MILTRLDPERKKKRSYLPAHLFPLPQRGKQHLLSAILSEAPKPKLDGSQGEAALLHCFAEMT